MGDVRARGETVDEKRDGAKERWKGARWRMEMVRRRRMRVLGEESEGRNEKRRGRRHKFRASVKRALRGEAPAPPICQYPEEIRGGTWPER